MSNAPQSTPENRPFLAGLWLIAAIPVSGLAWGLLDWILPGEMEDWLGLSVLSLGHFACGYLWARSLGRRAGVPSNRIANITAGIGFTLTVWGGRAAIEALDPLISQWLPAVQHAVHIEFTYLFVIWTGVVAGGTGLALGFGLKDWQLALKLFAGGFVIGALVFLIAAVGMDAIGFRVGTPRPDGLPSMVITTFLGIWATALLGSALFGRLLAGARSTTVSPEGLQGKA